MCVCVFVCACVFVCFSLRVCDVVNPCSEGVNDRSLLRVWRFKKIQDSGDSGDYNFWPVATCTTFISFLYHAIIIATFYNAHTDTRMHTHTHTHTNTPARTHTHTHTMRNTQTRTHTQTHKHTYIYNNKRKEERTSSNKSKRKAKRIQIWCTFCVSQARSCFQSFPQEWKSSAWQTLHVEDGWSDVNTGVGGGVWGADQTGRDAGQRLNLRAWAKVQTQREKKDIQTRESHHKLIQHQHCFSVQVIYTWKRYYLSIYSCIFST